MALKSIPWLTEWLALQHAQAQEEVAAQLVQRLTPMWSILDPEELQQQGDTTVAWLTAVVPLIATAYSQSQRLAAVFAQDIRWASLPTAEPLPLSMPEVEPPLDIPRDSFSQIDLDFGDDELWDYREFDVEEVAKSMYMNGPARVMANMGDKSLDEAMATADVTSKGAAIRQAVNGSRSVTRQVSEDDDRALGWARVTDNDPCYYCAILASRGAVYQKDSFVAKDASFANPSEPSELGDNWTDVAKVHDNCRCTLRPVFLKNQFRDREAWFYFEQWKQFAKGRNNKAAIREFRKRFVHYPRESSKLVNLEDIRARKRSLQQAGFGEDSPQVRWTERMDRRILRAA